MTTPNQSSFRDPMGVVTVAGDEVRRYVRQDAAKPALEFLNSQLASGLIDSGSLVETWLESEDENGAITLGHEKIEFPSYPYEWPAEMLHSAAELTIDLAKCCVEQGYGLKDATPFNVLFRGPRPIHVDFLSFEVREPSNPIWLAQGQFTRTFLLPLVAHQALGLPPRLAFLDSRDGLEPESVCQFAGFPRCLSPKVLKFALLPTLLNGKANRQGRTLYKPREVAHDLATYTLLRLLSNNRKDLNALSPGQDSSSWTEYSALDHVRQAEESKLAFLGQVLEKKKKPCRVLDVGCNTGTYSLAAARSGARVVAIDSDQAVVGQLWRNAKNQDANVLPLVVNLAHPTPSMGWRNSENTSFLDRAQGYFDCVLLFGVLHHLLVTERIPLPQILALVSELTQETAVIEYVPKDDPMFLTISRGRDNLHRDFTLDQFESTVQQRFRIVQRAPISGSGRILFELAK